MVCNFSLQHYEECLQLAKNERIEIIHDIDLPPNNVLRIAAIERSLGYKTKYFIRLHAKFYNALSQENISIFQQLGTDFGHELGLHFEPYFYESGSIRESIKHEALLLEKVLGLPIRYISVHSPLKAGGIDPKDVPSHMRYYGYDSDYYKGKKYLSDSGGRWREGCMCSHFEKHQELIVLAHASWWFEKTPSENY